MKLSFIRGLVEAFSQSSLTELDCVAPGTRVRIVKEGGVGSRAHRARSRPVSPPPDVPQRLSVAETITADGVGVFRSHHPTSSERFVMEGVSVRQGQIVAFLQIGPCLRPVTAPREGVIGACIGPEDTVVGYGSPLFVLDPS